MDFGKETMNNIMNEKLKEVIERDSNDADIKKPVQR